MKEITCIIDPVTGEVLIEEPEQVPPEVLRHLTEALGRGQEIACAVPLTMLPAPVVSAEERRSSVCVRIAGYYHNSLIEGPGRRSSVKLQGCPLHCAGCITPESWRPDSGSLVPVDRLAALLLDSAYARDGVSIAGGEPFYQPDALLALVHALRTRGCRHILAYSGYTYERLRRMAHRKPVIDAILDAIDVLIDGPFAAGLADDGDPWTGSRNQRVIDMMTTRRVDGVVLLEG